MGDRSQNDSHTNKIRGFILGAFIQLFFMVVLEVFYLLVSLLFKLFLKILQKYLDDDNLSPF